jgi:hypothetical protein
VSVFCFRPRHHQTIPPTSTPKASTPNATHPQSVLSEESLEVVAGGGATVRVTVRGGGSGVVTVSVVAGSVTVMVGDASVDAGSVGVVAASVCVVRVAARPALATQAASTTTDNAETSAAEGLEWRERPAELRNLEPNLERHLTSSG